MTNKYILLIRALCLLCMLALNPRASLASDPIQEKPKGHCWPGCYKERKFRPWICKSPKACADCGGELVSKTRSCIMLRKKGCSNGRYGGLDCEEDFSKMSCYMNMNKREGQAMTSYGWQNRDLPKVTWYRDGIYNRDSRYEWFHKRKPHQPIVGDSTVIAGVLFSFTNEILKLNAIFTPMHLWFESSRAYLDVTESDSGLTRRAECDIVPGIWTCLFRIEDLPQDEEYNYRITYRSKGTKRISPIYSYSGTIPKQVPYPRIAAISCFGIDDESNKDLLVDAVLENKPDLLVLQGDQTYLDKELGYGFLETLYSINHLTRSIPTIIQLDDHDYGLPNLWGAGHSQDDSGSGFGTLPPCLINSIQQLTMGHNPDSPNEDTLQNGIDAKYTNYIYGNLDLGVLEVRKFKNKKWVDDMSLLGKHQEEWLQNWCNTNTDKIKVVLAQTPFGRLFTHVSDTDNGHLINTPNSKSKDSNAFPPVGRKRAMNILSGCSSLVLSGDQHMSIAVRYEDFNITDCVSPAAINSVFWRLNKHPEGTSQVDAFGHEYKLLKIWNVAENITDSFSYPIDTQLGLSNALKHDRADGFMMVDFEGSEATCAAYGYRNSRSQRIWDVQVPVSLPNLV